MKEKVPFSTDKHSWNPSPLLGQIFLVTTINEDGITNIAPKSWISMMAFNPPLVVLGCNHEHQTAQNIIRSREFVVNVPGDDLAATAWECADLPHPRPVEAAGLTPLPATRVAPPLIEECRVHLECTLYKRLSFGLEVVIFGEILAGVIDQAALDAEDPYAYLRLFTYLEGRQYGVIERAEKLADN